MRFLQAIRSGRSARATLVRRCATSREFLADLEPRAPRRRVEQTVAYHDACHLAHAQRIRQEPRDLLCGIPGLTLVEIPDGDQCCGSAGTYNLFEPASAREIGLRKARQRACDRCADVLASGNPGCSLQIGALLRERGIELTILHPIEILDAAITASRRGRCREAARMISCAIVLGSLPFAQLHSDLRKALATGGEHETIAGCRRQQRSAPADWRRCRRI